MKYTLMFPMSDYPMLKALTATAVPAIIRCLELVEPGVYMCALQMNKVAL